jgi:hypothetical protein
MASGVLIHERAFLAAGHSVAPSLPSLPPGVKTYVTLHPNALNSAHWILAGAQVAHPSMPPCPPPLGCDPTTTEVFEAGDPRVSDLGLVFLTVPAAGIRPAKLAPPGLLERRSTAGERMETIGYGHPFPGAGGTSPPVSVRDGFRKYRKSTLNQVLNERWASWTLPSAVCWGDSGSPTFFDAQPSPRHKDTVLVAIASDGGADCLSTDLRSRVDTKEIQDWIRDAVRQHLGAQAALSMENK